MEEKKKGGRPRKPDRPTHAERQRAYRARINAKLAHFKRLERIAAAVGDFIAQPDLEHLTALRVAYYAD